MHGEKRRDTMSWLKFLMVDVRLMKSQKIFLAAFPLFAVVIGASSGDMLFIISYLCFGVMIVSTTPFLLESKYMSSFIHLLPGKERDKVAGRYACFLAMLLSFAAVGFCVCAALGALGHQVIQSGNVYISMAIIVVSIIVGSLQFVIFYVVGQEKSEQWLNIVRIVPAFLFFFATNYVIEAFADHEEKIGNILRFIDQNKTMLLIAGAILSLVVFFACIGISTAVIRRKNVI